MCAYITLGSYDFHGDINVFLETYHIWNEFFPECMYFLANIFIIPLAINYTLKHITLTHTASNNV